MKTVLCFGDSLTFGSDPEGGRLAFEDRWPTTLGQGLGADKVRIIAEGLGGRTTVFDDFSGAADRNGAALLPTLLTSHSPLDAVVIMLGTNDLKPFICGSAPGAAMGMKRLVEIIRAHPYGDGQNVPEIVLVAPPIAVPTDNMIMSVMFEDGVIESAKFAKYYTHVAEEVGCAFFDAATVSKPNSIDGIHMDGANTRALGTGLVPVVKKVLGL